ncbi:retinol dehydrogenase [Echria macrotheca]|uniref:Retinol dehydrogenase n=1 Tax=Echria macrotheca TaxID=438768 RepID=A0AAJ0BLJ5_9PEZI|nr:retinol dehydrogenase [Echria macrotheca]
MPLKLLSSLVMSGLPPWFPEPMRIVKVGSTIGALALTKWYASGSTCRADRDMHGRVVIITGGTTGIGAITAYELANRGAQIVLLTRQPPTDPFLAEFVDDLRDRTNNQLIYAEQVDLASLHSIRQFATRWVDNVPPRRLDMIILCAATLTPPGGRRSKTPEAGIETTWMVNFLANFHLLGILSPAIRAQPFDRDVRIIIPTCSTYIASPPLDAPFEDKNWSPGAAYARSKLALMVFAQAYQKHLDAYKRPDQLPMNARVFLADPGYTRTAGMMRWLTRGSLFGLLLYMLVYPLVWLLLKSPLMGAQTILYAALEGSLVREPGGKLFKECMEVDYARKDIKDEEVAKKLWEASDKLIEKAEKEAAVKRAKQKQEEEKKKEEEKQAKQVEEIESLVDAISKGKKKEAEKAKAKANTANKTKKGKTGKAAGSS